MEKLKNIPTKEHIHQQIMECAKSRGMTIIGLHERILKAWLCENFFAGTVASSKARSN